MLKRARPSFLRRYGADRRGAAAIEFALTLPVMLVMLFGEVEAGQLLTATRRADNAAASVGDIVARLGQMSDVQKSAVFAAANAVMAGAVPTAPDLRVSEVVVTASGVKKYQWSDSQGVSLPAHGYCETLSTTDAAKLSGMSLPAGSYVLLSELRYSWTSQLRYVLRSTIPIYYENVLNPRSSQVIRNAKAVCT